MESGADSDGGGATKPDTRVKIGAGGQQVFPKKSQLGPAGGTKAERLAPGFLRESDKRAAALDAGDACGAFFRVSERGFFKRHLHA